MRQPKNQNWNPPPQGHYPGFPPYQYPPQYHGRVYPPGVQLPPGAYQEPPRKGRATWSVALLIPLLIILAVFIILIFVGKPYIVRGLSMYPTLNDGDRVFVVPYRGNTTPDRGDIVVLRDIGRGGEMLIKRVVALPGDRITGQDGNLVVNGQYYHKSTGRFGDRSYTQIVPENEYFVMGDNESNSYDSRYFGTITSDKIVGKALVIFWPPGDLKKL
ncbi:MAG: signal peptidase I [Actinobacteria bacterium]|nr:signal peptidase I [Actinomycetota bacterium]MBU1944095.1 signal peptidase I [Actinomycetota bacterium]MBU2687016.1 signal peptidase I [Actinomycetota bacterium]